MNHLLFAALAIALAACSGARAPLPASPAPTQSCVIGAAHPSARDTLVVATISPVDWGHVPQPTNAAERLAFAQAYETLIDVDCDGRARPGLAATWDLDATKTRIILTLRNGARFWSGKPVTANDVLAAWQSTPSRLARAIIRGTTVVDEHTLIVSLPDSGWLALADPTLAVYAPQSAAWPDGSGTYRITEQFTLAPAASTFDPYLVMRSVPSGDPRDAIDAGSDVLVTGDPLAVSYAAARPNLIAIPLAWSRTYVLALPQAAPKITQSLAHTLAPDAVRAAARVAEPPYWWDDAHACDAVADSLRARRSNRVVYRRDDAVARGLAERLVALDASTVAAGLAPNDFARALRDGGDVAYVLDLPRVSLSPCNDFAELRAAAPWLASLVPLIDTRETAIINRDRVSATVDWRGTLHFGSERNRP